MTRRRDKPSMSRIGNPHDNAKAERFIKTLEQEEVDGRAHRDIGHARTAIGTLSSRSHQRTAFGRDHRNLSSLSCLTFGVPSTTLIPFPVARKPHGNEFAPCLDFARDQAMSGHGWAPHGRKEDTGVSNGDQASCPVVRARAGGGDACGLRPAHGHRAIGVAGRQPAGVPGAGGAAAPGIGRDHRRVAAASRKHTRSPPGRPPPNRRPSTDGSVGIASFYKHGSKTANGEQFNPGELTAAHRTLPFGTRLRVTNVATAQSVTVRVNDRGPFIPGRVVDLSHSAAEVLGMVDRGITKVKLEVEK